MACLPEVCFLGPRMACLPDVTCLDTNGGLLAGCLLQGSQSWLVLLETCFQIPPGTGFPRDADRTRTHDRLLHCRHARPGGRHHSGQRLGGRSQEALSEAQRLRECLPEQVRPAAGAGWGFQTGLTGQTGGGGRAGPDGPCLGLFFFRAFFPLRKSSFSGIAVSPRLTTAPLMTKVRMDVPRAPRIRF